MKVWAYVFITTNAPRKVVQALRQIPGVIQADGLFGVPDAIAIVEGEDIASVNLPGASAGASKWNRLCFANLYPAVPRGDS